jgi:hypothetical protein
VETFIGTLLEKRLLVHHGESHEPG